MCIRDSLVRGNTYLRDINRKLNWNLPTDSAKTLNGLITDYLEDIPYANTSIKIDSYVIEILQTRDTAIHVARISEFTEPKKTLNIA